MFLCALSSIAVTLGIVGILLFESWNFFKHVSLLDFLTDTNGRYYSKIRATAYAVGYRYSCHAATLFVALP